jgi:hypothetical protein
VLADQHTWWAVPQRTPVATWQQQMVAAADAAITGWQQGALSVLHPPGLTLQADANIVLISCVVEAVRTAQLTPCSRSQGGLVL